MQEQFDMPAEVIAGVHRQVAGMRAAGSTIHYIDPRWPGRTIREYPDGRRVFVELDRQHGLIEMEDVSKIDRAA